MGELEKENRKNVRKTALQHAILSSVATSGLVATAVLAPNVLYALGKLGLVPHSRQDDITKSAASRLKKKGLLKFANGFYQLTADGEKVLERWERKHYLINKPKKWDKKWRVIIFDIPEKKKLVRERVRGIFSEAGFTRLQDSVWVHPYDCEDVIGLLKTELGVGKDMIYMIVDKIEGDRELRRHFGL
ncbi:MAG: hypothetical protein WD874_02120 [Parcubacteria group bacterium]